MNLEPLLLQRDGEITDNISKIFDLSNVVKIENTILDPIFQNEGCTIDLGHNLVSMFGTFNSVYIPPCPIHMEETIAVLDDIAVRANNVLRVKQLVEKGEKAVKVLNKSFINYQMTVLSRLVGKSGIVCRNILGRRVQYSGRAVLLPSYSHNPYQVYIPAHMMRKMRINEGDIVIVGRDPTIWMGSLEILHAYPTEEDVIRLHPYVFSQFGADCDGDTVWCMRIPDDIQPTLVSRVLGFTKRHQDKIKLANSGSKPIQIDWSDPAVASIAMANTTGFSVSPQDILNDSEDLCRFKNSTGKNIGDEARFISSGLNIKDYTNYLTTINETMLIQKIYLGPVGSASQKLKLIAGRNEGLLESANYISERIQQMLFDVKGSIQGSNDDLMMFFEILDIVNMNGDYSSTESPVSYKRVLDRLETFGLDRSLSCPIIIYMYLAYPLFEAFWVLSAANKISGKITEEQRLEMIKSGAVLLTEPSKNKEIIKQFAEFLEINPQVVIDNAMSIKSTLSLGKILRDPLFSIINPFSEDQIIKSINYLDHILNTGEGHSKRLTDWIFIKSMEREDVLTKATTESTETSGVQVPSKRS